MPVLPDVGSMSTWSGLPGTSTPECSASSMSDSATRSFTEPPGFCPSSFMKMRAEGFGLNALMSTIGVLPIISSTDGYNVMDRLPEPTSAPGHGREDRHLGPVLDGRVEALQVAHVVVVDVDVHELVQGTIVGEHLARHPRVLGDELGEDLTDGGAVDADGGRAPGVATQDG